MNIIQQAKSKLKPPPPPPKKPSHLSQSSSTTTSSSAPILPKRPINGPSHKRGLGWPWDFQPPLYPLFTNNANITWLFNWELWVPAALPSHITWVPCVRTAAQCNDIVPFLTDISTNQGRQITHFLGFNEPEIPSQANLGVAEAVQLWRDYVMPAKAKFGFQLGSPGLSSDVGKSVGWMDPFLEALGGTAGAQIDFLVLHWYGPRFAEMRQFLELMHERYHLPVWVNEFACSKMGDGEVREEDVEAFLREAIPWLERCPWVERYAYFGNGQGQDVGTWVGRASNFTELAEGCKETGGRQLSRIGKLYLSL